MREFKTNQKKPIKMLEVLLMRLIVICLTIALLAVGLVQAANINTDKEKSPVTGRWAVIETNKGTIKFALYEKDAPITTKNFIDLANSKFYDGLTFHRVEPGFVIQGGDPNGNGTGGSGKNISLEVSPNLKHDAAGVVAMARSSDPNSASCQFYITLGEASFLDMNYAVFGRVTEGLDVVQKIERGDIMKTVRIISAPGQEKKATKQDGNKKGQTKPKSKPKATPKKTVKK
jgi:cyclophilin family peptidyl-prolyl cis-trans isomerase